MNSNPLMILLVMIMVSLTVQLQLIYALDNITILDYTGNVVIIRFPNGTTYNLDVAEYSNCVANMVMKEGISRYLVEGAEEDEILTDNELGIAEAMESCVG